MHAGAIGGLGFALGGAIPLAVMITVPVSQRVWVTFAAVLLTLALTGWFASGLTGLPVLRLVLRNLVLGAATMAAGLIVGLAIGI